MYHLRGICWQREMLYKKETQPSLVLSLEAVSSHTKFWPGSDCEATSWHIVGQPWVGAADQVKPELSRTVNQYCKNYAKTMMIYLRRGRSNNDVSKLFTTFFLRSGLGNMCPHGRMRLNHCISSHQQLPSHYTVVFFFKSSPAGVDNKDHAGHS